MGLWQKSHEPDHLRNRNDECEERVTLPVGREALAGELLAGA